jgi:hypothetical protein
MNRILLPAFVAVLAVGCGKAAVQNQASAVPAEKPVATEQAQAPVVEYAPSAQAEGPREVGDYVVYRFSGSFQKGPVTLTERVVARDKEALVLDVVLEEGGKKHEMRVRTSQAPENRGETLSVARIEKGAEVPMSVADYEDLMSRTMLVADSNEAELDSEDVTVALGDTKLPARKTSFRVKVGGKTATLRTVVSEKFPWGDVAGEIAAEDGDVLYRAEVVTVGHKGPAQQKPAKEPAVAASAYDEFE